MSPVAISGVDKQGVAINGVQVKQVLSAANSTVNKGVYDATLLETVDPDLAAANILQPVEIFGKVGTVVAGVDISDADALVTDVKDPKTFYSVAAPRKTGTMPTVAIVAANDNYPAGYHAGDAGGLDAIDLDLASANIKSGVTIFGKAGAATVQDIADADLVVAEAPTGKKFYAVTGGVKTGTGTKTLDPASEAVAAGYYAATTLSAVDADLAVGNIKSGVTIFGKLGTVIPGGVETVDEVYDAQMASFAAYTPAIKGTFFCGKGGAGNAAVQYYSTGGVTWYTPKARTKFIGFTAIGDGANFRIWNPNAWNINLTITRHNYSTATYTRERDEQLAAGANWTPATSGFFASATEGNCVSYYFNDTVATWYECAEAWDTDLPVTIMIGNGANFRVLNEAGVARRHVAMRVKMI